MNLLEILGQGESASIEFKETAKAEIGKEVAAFASSRGGQILVGVRDKDHCIIGLTEPFDVVTSKVASWVHEFVSPPPRYAMRRLEHDEASVLLVNVQPGPAAAYAYKQCFYYRNADQSQPMPASEISRRFVELQLASDLEPLAAHVERARPEHRTAAAIFGQGELATMTYQQLVARLIADLSQIYVTKRDVGEIAQAKLGQRHRPD